VFKPLFTTVIISLKTADGNITPLSKGVVVIVFTLAVNNNAFPCTVPVAAKDVL
jgi:hypothetical protein